MDSLAYEAVQLKLPNQSTHIRALVAGVAATLSLLTLASCESDGDAPASAIDQAPVPETSTRVYTMDSLASLGWKRKGGFERQFEAASETAWGFHEAREVAAILYASPEQARLHGPSAGKSQTALTAEGRFEPGVERTKCGGFGNYRTPYKLAMPEPGTGCGSPARPGRHATGSKCTLFFGHAGSIGSLTDGSRQAGAEALAPTLIEGLADGGGAEDIHFQRECPQRIPVYADFVIEGNLVFMCEPKNAGDLDACRTLVIQLRAQ